MGSGGCDLIDADVTMRDRGVPYVVGGDKAFNEMSVQGADVTSPLLTIEAGVVLKCGKVSSGLPFHRACADPLHTVTASAVRVGPLAPSPTA